MVATAISVERALEWQETALRYSQVTPVACHVDPMERCYRRRAPYRPRTREEAAALRGAAAWLEAGYGFRQLGRNGRLTRRAPSAGALYPIEILVTLRAAAPPVTLLYQFTAHEFYAVPNARAAGTAGGDESVIDIHVISVFWRTVQRYGVRGYRYCLLDAANVVDNLVYLMRSASPQSSPAFITASADAHSMLALEYGEGCIGTLRVPLAALSHFETGGHSPQLLDGRVGDASEAAPFLSPELQRVTRLHEQVCQEGGQIWQVDNVDAAANAPAIVNARYSARGFSGDPLPPQLPNQVFTALFQRHDSWVPHEKAISYCFIHLRPESPAAGAIRGTTAGRFSEVSVPGGVFAQACQGQAIVRQAPFAVIFMCSKTLDLHSQQDYVGAVLSTGQRGAMLHRLAVRMGVGTSIVGGFSDSAVAAVINRPDMVPLMVQLFGLSDEDQHKRDVPAMAGTRVARRHP